MTTTLDKFLSFFSSLFLSLVLSLTHLSTLLFTAANNKLRSEVLRNFSQNAWHDCKIILYIPYIYNSAEQSDESDEFSVRIFRFSFIVRKQHHEQVLCYCATATVNEKIYVVCSIVQLPTDMRCEWKKRGGKKREIKTSHFTIVSLCIQFHCIYSSCILMKVCVSVGGKFSSFALISLCFKRRCDYYIMWMLLVRLHHWQFWLLCVIILQILHHS